MRKTGILTSKKWYDLTGQGAVVTGGASGPGLAITHCLISAGAKVCVIGSRAEEAAAEALAEYGVTVNAIAPGSIDTPHVPQGHRYRPQRLGKILGRIPAKSVGGPMDAGMCAAFLASDAARCISGSCIPVDGALIGF